MDTTRFNETKKLNKEIYRVIYPVFRDQHKFNHDLVDEFFLLLNKRLEKGQCFRPYYMKVMFDYVKQCMINEKQDVSALKEPRMKQLLEIELPFFAEAIIVIQYLDNHILDEKNGIKENNKALKKVMLSSNIMKEYLWEYINDIRFENRDLECTVKKAIRKYISKIFLYVDLGQAIELDWNRYSILKNNITPTESPFGEELEAFIDFSPMKDVYGFIFKQFDKKYHTYLELYLKRIYLTTGTLYILMVELLMELMKYEGIEKKNIEGFVRCYGVGNQILNDNCDIVPSYFNQKTNAKIEQDAFSDLRNGCITLPLLFYYIYNQKKDAFDSFLEKTNNSKKEINRELEILFFSELKKSHAIFKSISIAKLFKSQAVKYLFERNIRGVLDIFDWNKFYYEIYQDKGMNKKFKHSVFYEEYKRLSKEKALTQQSVTLN